MEDDASVAEQRTWWVLTPDMERTLRFVIGMALVVWTSVFADSLNPTVFGGGLILAGSPLANMADDARRALRRNGDGP